MKILHLGSLGLGGPEFVLSLGLLVAPLSTAHAAPPSEVSSPKDGSIGPARDAPADGKSEEAPAEDAPPNVRARYWFERGYEAAASEDYGSAGRAFDHSFEAIAAANTLFNAAFAYEQGGLRLEALERYRLYLERFKKQAFADEAETALIRLEAQLAELSVRIMGAQEPVSIEVQGRTHTRGDFPVWLEPGEVEVVVIDGNEERRSENLLLRPGQRRTLELTFVETVVPVGPRPEGPTPPTGMDAAERERQRHADQFGWSKKVFWSTASVAIVAGVGVATFGSLSLREQQRYKDGICEMKEDGSCVDGSTHPEKERRLIPVYTNTTNALIGVASGVAALSLAFGLVWRRAARAQSAGDKQEKRSVRLRPSAEGLSLEF